MPGAIVCWMHRASLNDADIQQLMARCNFLMP